MPAWKNRSDVGAESRKSLLLPALLLGPAGAHDAKYSRTNTLSAWRKIKLNPELQETAAYATGLPSHSCAGHSIIQIPELWFLEVRNHWGFGAALEPAF